MKTRNFAIFKLCSTAYHDRWGVKGSLSAYHKSLKHTLKIFLEKINKVREKIFFADNQLNDCIEIIEGYQSTIENYSHLDKEDKNFNVGDPQPPNTHDHGDIDQNELSELQGSLSNLNEILKND